MNTQSNFIVGMSTVRETKTTSREARVTTLLLLDYRTTTNMAK